jgi:pilus assembly protein FimV
MEDKPAAPEPEAFDSDFDLSLDELEAASPAEVKGDQQTFESVLQQQTEPRPVTTCRTSTWTCSWMPPASAQSDDDFPRAWKIRERCARRRAADPDPAALDDWSCRKISTCRWRMSPKPPSLMLSHRSWTTSTPSWTVCPRA